jgi:hypothetical protein
MEGQEDKRSLWGGSLLRRNNEGLGQAPQPPLSSPILKATFSLEEEGLVEKAAGSTCNVKVGKINPLDPSYFLIKPNKPPL